jgi:hypothetical protein
MIGDQADITRRIKAVLPTGWFADTSPVLDSILSGVSQVWVWIYDWIAYAKSQTRVETASGLWLDLITLDYFGPGLPRRSGETDNHFRHRIKSNLLRERVTRSAIITVLTELTGRPPKIFEPAHCLDTGGYGVSPITRGGLAYSAAGGWGSLALPFQCFIIAYRPVTAGIATVSGWGCPLGGYGAGAIEYADLSLMEGRLADSEIYTAISSTLPIGVIGWTKIID